MKSDFKHQRLESDYKMKKRRLILGLGSYKTLDKLDMFALLGRNATFAIGETRFGLRSKHQRLESDRKMKKDV